MLTHNGEFHNQCCYDVMSKMADNSVHMTLTDVPYNEVNRKSGGLRNLDKGIADSAPFDIDKLASELVRVTSGSIYVFCATEQISQLRALFVKEGLTTRVGVWNKTNPSPMNGDKLWLSGLEFCVFARHPKATFNEHCKSPLWTFPTQRSKIHPTQKSEKLFDYLIETSSNPGDIIFDPFAGSGTTAVCAERLGRKWICVEKDEGFYDLAVERVKSIYV